MHTHHKGHSVNGPKSTRQLQEEEIAPGDFDLPTADDQAKECQFMNLTTLREVFANRKSITKKEARGASLVFRGVSGQMRALEYGQRE